MELVRKICNICNKSFSNGKALGGHIRSHLAKFKLPSTENPAAIPTPTRRRSSRSRRTALSEEEAASFLVHLSRDTWHKKKKKISLEEEEEEEEEEEGVMVLAPVPGPMPGTSEKIFRCEPCDREFESYQALGGHKANHRKKLSMSNNKINIYLEKEEERSGKGNITSKKRKRGVFKCELCYKVFESGQALGGHKKSHFSTAVPKNVVQGTLVIDLNFPPISEEDDDYCDYDYQGRDLIQFPLL